VVFKVDTTGNETVLYTFPACLCFNPYPVSGLVLDSAGNLYGTVGGTLANGQQTFGGVFYQFTGGADGSSPLGRRNPRLGG